MRPTIIDDDKRKQIKNLRDINKLSYRHIGNIVGVSKDTVMRVLESSKTG